MTGFGSFFTNFLNLGGRTPRPRTSIRGSNAYHEWIESAARRTHRIQRFVVLVFTNIFNMFRTKSIKFRLKDIMIKEKLLS